MTESMRAVLQAVRRATRVVVCASSWSHPKSCALKKIALNSIPNTMSGSGDTRTECHWT